jgi:uncharacterized protein YdeI (YjbR/CyaY-like superfamily)
MTDPAPDRLELLFDDAKAWRRWLDAHEDDSDGAWLVLAKKGTTTPTSLRYEQALHEALCSGWIDGQGSARDQGTMLQRFTPRRRRSTWSARNVGIVAQLAAEGRMRPRGEAEIEAAKADGRWERAYAGSATVQAPDDLAAALAASPRASEAFDALKSQGRFTALRPIITLAPGATRERRVKRLIEALQSQDARPPQ